jgi:TM2 domain-containing membrane protein YozV
LSLGLSQTPYLETWQPEPRHKSAGLAFLLSFFIPGAGQLYCGKIPRGFTTLGFFVGGAILTFAAETQTGRGNGLAVAFVLWIFAFLDAYFTALEINSGVDEQVDPVNPRVAVTLNLLTAGLGYFYLGQRTKGFVLFLLLNAIKALIAATTGFWSGVASLLAITIGLIMGVDAYRLAKEQLRENRGPQPKEAALTTKSASRLPAFIPVALASIAGIGFLGLAIVGLAMRAAGGNASGTAAVRIPPRARSLHRFAPGSPQALRAEAVDDFLSAVGDIQRIQKKADRGPDDLIDLGRDFDRISAQLSGGHLDPSDLNVAYFYRGEAGALTNNIRRHHGGSIDLSVAHHALDDFQQVISHFSNTYDPVVSLQNAQYWAGIVERNDLHSEADAYAYWDQCAQRGHAGCQVIMADAHISGKGGQKIDLQQALDLHTAVFNTGTRARCAGAYSALSIARINYFTGTRRPGDNELEWLKKSYELMDKLEAAEDNRSACQHSAAEVEEFLYRLSKGHRREHLLQDATERLGQNSTATRALIDLLSGTTDKAGFEATLASEPSKDQRCSAYFDSMWYAELQKKHSDARDYHRRMSELGRFFCGTELALSSKFNL